MSPGRIYITFALLLISLNILGQPDGYYSQADGLTGTELKQALHNIIDNQSVRTYSQLWTDFQRTDRKSDGTVWDMYSDIPGGSPNYVYHFITDQCGNYSSEGDCYNREHSFPKSWFGGEVEPMYTDLFHLYPTDGYVNNRRGNFPFGVTNSPSWTSSNGSKVGPCSSPGYSGTVFEPVDEYKGDFARSLLYMAVRYYGEDSAWPGSDMTKGAEPLPWALDLLAEWSKNDPVSQKEADRNDSIYAVQGNRNPFIDNQSWVNDVWSLTSSAGKVNPDEQVILYPNPVSDILNVSIDNNGWGGSEITIYDCSGTLIIERRCEGNRVSVNTSGLSSGIYILVLTRKNTRVYKRFVVMQ